MDAEHLPVLVAESLDWLAPARGGLFVDLTLGLGGHAEALLDAAPAVRLVAFDRDPEARAIATRRLARFGDRIEIVGANFRELEARLDGRRAAGVLADLGVSSLQLDRAERGFAFRSAGPLDMRMEPTGPTAGDLVHRSTEAELTKIFREYGEEPQARRIARAIVREREERPIESTVELAEIVRGAKRRHRGGRERIDPATQAFQALRIAVNDELGALEEMLDQAVRALDRDGRLVVISYHSLEDRRVKNHFRDLARGEVDPVTGRTVSESRVLEVLTKRPIAPSEAEVERNPRSRSARLRAARRL